MVELKQIQVAIEVVIKKDGLGGKTDQIQLVINGFIRINRNTIFDAFTHKQLVLALNVLIFTELPYVQIEHAVVVDIHHTHAGRPTIHTRYTRLLGNVFEFEVSFIEEHLIRPHVAGKIQIDQAIVVKIARSNPTSIKKIHVVKHVKGTALPQYIFKIEACYVFAQQLKNGVATFCFLTSGEKYYHDKPNQAKRSKLKYFHLIIHKKLLISYFYFS